MSDNEDYSSDDTDEDFDNADGDACSDNPDHKQDECANANATAAGSDEEIPFTNLGTLPSLSGALGRRKRKRAANAITSPAQLKRKATKEEIERYQAALKEARNIQTLARMGNVICCAADKCRRPGGATDLDPEDFRCSGHCQHCKRCNQIAHYICMQRRRGKLFCRPCFDIDKQEHPVAPRLPSQPKHAGLKMPSRLRRHIKTSVWQQFHCKDEMNEVLAR